MAQFFSKEETSMFVMRDRDEYIQRMTAPDLFARNCIVSREYKELAAKSAVDFEPHEKMAIKRMIVECDVFFNTLNDLKGIHDNCYGAIHGYDIVNIPWVFAKTTLYEQGFPHTRENVIFVGPSFIPTTIFYKDVFAICSTLIHEKIHVYQRLYSDRFTKWLFEMGYQKMMKRNWSPLTRSNPDLDSWMYRHPTGKIMHNNYNSLTPLGISDVSSVDEGLVGSMYEHPNEEIAYKIANIYTERASKYKN